MDRSGQDLFMVIGAPSLRRNENLESLVQGSLGSSCQGQGNDGITACKLLDGQPLARDRLVHSTIDVVETPAATCPRNATPAVFEKRTGESWCSAESNWQENPCPGKLREDSPRPAAAAGELYGESAGCDSNRHTGQEDVEGDAVRSGTARRATGSERAGGMIAEKGAVPTSPGVGRGRDVEEPGLQQREERAADWERAGSSGTAQEASGAEGLVAELRRLRARDSSQQDAEWEPGGAPCGFGSSLCFTAAPGDEREAAAGGEQAREPVVNSQRQINNSGLQEEAAARWSLEPGGGDAPKNGHAQGTGQPESDLVIEVAGRRIHAHKAVLCARSEYFRARRSRQVVRVRGVGLPAMYALLDYAYGAPLRAPTLGAREGVGVEGADDVDPQAAAALLAAAHALQMPNAARAAVQALKSQLRVRTCGQLLALAKRQRMPELGDVALGFMSDHYLAVLREPAVYGRLSAAERELILQRREAPASGPRCLVVAELSDVYERQGGSRPVSRESSRPQSPCSPERAPCSPEPSGGDGDARWLYCRDADTGEWRRLSRVPEAAAETRGCGVCALHNYLFVAGGTWGRGRGARPSARVFAYNPATGGWSEARAMGQARSQLRLVALDGLLYALGGECVLGVERYDPRADRWAPVAPLPRGGFAVAPEAAACRGRLYLTGGSLSGRLLAYEPRRDEWDECPGSPGAGGRTAGLVARAHWLYRLELDREQRAVAVLRYNTVARVWAEAAGLRPGPVPLQPFRCAALGRAVYCVSKAGLLTFQLPDDGDQKPGEEAFSCRLLATCAQAQGPLFPVFLTVPENPRDRPCETPGQPPPRPLSPPGQAL